MGHAAHFLRRVQRLDDRHLDLAMGLYRDPRAVRLVLDSQPLPDDAERVALALADTPEPPHVIVTRDGAFVTCLAPGMVVKRDPVVPRAALDAAFENSARLELLDARIAHRGGVGALLDRVFQAGGRLPREDYEALAVMAPLVLPVLVRQVSDASRIVFDMHRGITPRRLRRTDRAHVRELRRYIKACATLRHVSLLMTECAPLFHALDGPLDGLLEAPGAALVPGDFAGLTTAATTAAELGPALIPAYQRQWQAARTLLDALPALVGLIAIGVRHVPARPDAVQALADEAAPLFADAGQADVARWVVEETRKMFELDECELHERATRASVRQAESQKPEPLIPADASDALVDALLGASGGSCFATPTSHGAWLPMITWAARRRPAELYLPHTWLRRLHTGQDIEIVRGALDDWLRYTRRGEPITRAAPKTGRNDPCPCGSGRKYKRCCLRSPR